MKKQNLFAAVLVVFSLVSSNAMASGGGGTSFSIVGAIDYPTTSVTVGTFETKGKLGFGGGLLMDHSLGGPDLEIGAIYLARKLESTNSGVVIATSNANGINIPVMLRWGHSFSWGIGGFYDIAMTSGNSSDYGVTGGIRFGEKFFVDARFNYGLKSQGTGVTYHNQEVLALLGYKFH